LDALKEESRRANDSDVQRPLGDLKATIEVTELIFKKTRRNRYTKKELLDKGEKDWGGKVKQETPPSRVNARTEGKNT